MKIHLVFYQFVRYVCIHWKVQSLIFICSENREHSN